MLYLKLYEAFNREDFYQEIGIDEYDEKTSKDRRNLLTREYESLEKITDKEYYFFEDNIVDKNYLSLLFNNTCIEVGFGDHISSGFSDKVYFFNKVKDEWWYVCEQKYQSVGSRFDYYKCDQWEGLMKFLEDKKLVK